MSFSDLNLQALLFATFTYFAIGYVWYSPILFGRVWANDAKISGDKILPPVIILVFNFIFLLMVIVAVALFMGDPAKIKVLSAVKRGLLAAGFISLPTLATTYLNEGRSLRLFLIDSFYHLLGLTSAILIYCVLSFKN